MNLRMGVRDWFYIVTLASLWGASYFFVEIALRGFETLTLVFVRTSIASLTLLAYVRVTGKTMPVRFVEWRQFFVMGALGSLIPFSLIIWGQTRIDGGLASILNATTPLFVVFLAHFFTTDERYAANRGIGVFFGLLGVTVLVGPNVLLGLGGEALGEASVLAGSVFYAMASIYGRRLVHYPISVVSAGALAATATTMLPLMLIFENPFDARPGADAWSAAIALSLLGTTVGFLLYFKLLARVGAVNVSLVGYLIPIVAMTMGAVLLGEEITGLAITGLVLIFTGLLIADGRVIKRLRARSRAGGKPR